MSTKKSSPSQEPLPTSPVDRDPRSAKQGRGEREADAGEGKRLVGAEKGADAAEQKRRDERDVDDRPQVAERIERAQFGVREVLREMEAENGAETGDPEDRREQAADEAVSEGHRLGRLEREMRLPRTVAGRSAMPAPPPEAPERRTAPRTAGHRAVAARR